MGRTLLGVDLDESHVGGLVKRLLTDEELEKLADGGRLAADGGDETDESGDGADGGDADDDGDGFEFGGDDADDDTTDDDTTGEAAARDETTGEQTTDDETAGHATARDESEGIGTGTGPGGTGWTSVGTGPATGSVGDRDAPDIGLDDPSWETGEADDSDGRLGGHGPIVLKGGAVLLVLVVLALVVWRYGGRIKAALPFVGGSDGSEGPVDAEAGDSTGPGSDSGSDADVSPARRRAKVGARDDTGSAPDVGGDTAFDAADGAQRDGSDASDGTGDDERESSAGGGVDEGVDLGALVGLGVLALVAALVRKYGDDRPRDPLVDGPEE